MRILAVDDERLIRMSLRLVLHRAGFEVDTARSGAEALACLHDRSYDLVFTDLDLPDLDGLVVLREARAMNPQVKVIVITAEDGEALEALERREAVGVVRKPFSLAKLVEQARGVARGEVPRA